MGATTVLRSVLALAVATLLGGTLLAFTPTASGQVAASSERATPTHRVASCDWRAHHCFGAISLNTRTGQVGYANDKRSRAAAIRVAQTSCRTRSADTSGSPGQCRRAGWVRNGCLAVAVRIRDRAIVEWGAAIAYDPDPAKRKARRKVAGPGRTRIAFWLCTSRSH